MAVSMYVAFAVLAAFIGTIEYRQMLVFEIRSAFDHHGTAYIIVGGLYFLLGKAQGFQQAEIVIEVLLGFKAEALQAFFAQGIGIEYKADLESAFHGGIQL